MTDPDSHPRAAASVREGLPIDAQDARQGRRGVHVAWVLGVSTLLAALILLGLVFANSRGFSRTREDIGNTPADARAFNQDEPLTPKQGSPRAAPSPE